MSAGAGVATGPIPNAAPALRAPGPRPLPVDRFEPVTLGELVGEAELLTRVDRKYLLPAELAAEAMAVLDPRSRALQIGGLRAFGYESVYFDTPDRLAYRLTAQKRRHRFKLRTRRYVDTGGCFLEVKTKDGRGTTVKQRIGYEPVNLTRLTRAGRVYAGAVLGEHGHDAAIVDLLGPSMTSRYRRATLLLPCGSRATFDTELRWSGPDGREVDLPGYAIVESKSAGRASALDRALWRAGRRPTGISKFGTGTAALHPELPSNKWARVLRGPFQTEIRNGETP